MAKALLAAIRTGAPYRIACMACGISEDAFTNWRRADLGFSEKVEQASGQTALRLLKKIEAQGKENFSACAWLLERRFPESFSRPETQLNLAIQNNTTQNFLTINITGTEAMEIEAQADPVRRGVAEMFEKYRPGLGNGDGERTVDVEAEPIKKPEDLTPIIRKEGDQNSSAFWALFAGGTGERTVEKACATFVAKTIVEETVGRGISNQAIVAFKSEKPTVADVLAVIDRLCGGPAGWQLLQKKANVAK